MTGFSTMTTDYKHTLNLPRTDFPMRGNLPKQEPQWLEKWEAADLYGEIQKRTAQRKHMFVLHDGPPYANGNIHLGHAVNKILKDITVKSKLMAGYHSPYVPGWDCHGLPIEIAVEKKYGRVGRKLDANAFRAKCREYALGQIDLQRDGFKRLGVLGDWEQPYRTLDHSYEADILRSLARIIDNGHVVRGFKPVHWCFDCGSALAEAEIEYQDKQSQAIDVAYDAVDTQALAAAFNVESGTAHVAVPIWTTTPWTLPASMAVSIGPQMDYVLMEGPERGGGRVLLVVAEALAATVAERYGVESLNVLGRAKGEAFSGMELHHPFYERVIPLIEGEHVSDTDGTGNVHTAPGHGVEDFDACREHGIVEQRPAAEINPVDARGVYLPGTPLVEGEHIWKANDTILGLLRERGLLLASETITHSYPHCWRHKSPVAFRATPQWFISMDKAKLRATAMSAIDGVRWVPSWGRERIAGMVEGRPDWCISRQRTWGVPIALFVHKHSSEPHPRSVELLEQVAQRVEQGGIDAWFALDAVELLGDEAESYEKVNDVLDVWFDSGVTHACVLDARPELRANANTGDYRVMYLEGSDQHRGWFQSSLLTSAAMHGRAPYNQVLTHGFTVDQHGRKMSKSLGNGIEPQDIMQRLGADILRLWIASADYAHEMSLSEEILKRVTDSYRRIRNTSRFLLANLDGFDPARHLLPVEQCLPLDQWAVQVTHDLQTNLLVAYQQYDYPHIVQRIQNFCTNEMGSLYLDITKDRLYTMPTDSLGRRSAQSAMYRIAEALVRWLAPILSFTAAEIWQNMPGERADSVLFETWYEGLAAEQGDATQRAWWTTLRAIRETASRTLETMRKNGDIGASLQAEITIYADAQVRGQLAESASELRFYFITSDVHVARLEDRPVDAQRVELEAGEAWVQASVSGANKCVRCWHHREDVGTNDMHPELCGRCIDNVDGDGEARRWF